MKLQELKEDAHKPTIEELLRPNEMEEIRYLIKQGQSTEQWQQTVERRLRKMNLNVPLNISTYLKWIHTLDKKYNPNKFATPDTTGAWGSDYVKDREQRIAQRQQKGLDPYAGD